MKFVPVCLCCYFSHYRSKSCKSMAPDSLDSATKQDWTTDIIMFLLWLCHVSPLAELHPCIHNQRTPNFAVYNHTYIYMYRYIYLYICVCVCASGPWRSWSQAQPRGRRQGAEPLNIYIHIKYVKLGKPRRSSGLSWCLLRSRTARPRRAPLLSLDLPKPTFINAGHARSFSILRIAHWLAPGYC